jgi:magnesium chelatase family protein
LYSLIHHSNIHQENSSPNETTHKIVEVEVVLTPGLPQIQIVGLPDQVIKESALRIRSALKKQGFEFPKAQTILVNLRPSHLKKNSLGIELAVALGLLIETEQIKPPDYFNESIIYGELNLSGEVIWPEDLPLWQLTLQNWPLITGQSPTELEHHPSLVQLKELKDLSQKIQISESRTPSWKLSPPPFLMETVNPEEAEFLKMVALGEHSSLIAGSHGSGKTTLAHTLHSLIETKISDPHIAPHTEGSPQQPREFWRLLVKPHPTTPMMSLLGGGHWGGGEIVRAHGGVLLMDEFLEFHPKVLEALRQPLEEGLIRVARQGSFKEYPARFLFSATTNLCPCGRWVPGNSTKCNFTLARCRSYQNRFSGPLIDRIEVLYLKQSRQNYSAQVKEKIKLSDIQNQLAEVRLWREQEGRGDIINSRALIKDLYSEKDLQDFDKIFPRSLQSERRKNATLRVAKSLADLDFSPIIRPLHFERALFWAYDSFEQLKKWDI